MMKYLALVAGIFATSAVFAEPPVQPGQTLESLSQAQVSTTVNGQPGSLQQLMQSGQYKPVDASQPQPPVETPQPAPMAQ